MIRARVTDIISQVQGTLTLSACEHIYHHTKDVPDKGVILDLCCGVGRSTVLLGMGLGDNGIAQPRIISVDTHVTNPLSTAPYSEGTLMSFLHNVRHWNLQDVVCPVISPPDAVHTLVNKRSINMAVVQSPVTQQHEFCGDALVDNLQLALHCMRQKGHIVVCCSNSSAVEEFNTLVDRTIARSKLEELELGDDSVRVFAT